MKIPTISVCIPTFNRANYLQQCLSSLVEQFDNSEVKENIEIIISDNASTDNTENIVKEYKNKFDNIFYFRNSENIRVDRNILNTVDKATGEYIWFLGDDDALFPTALDYMLQELKLKKFKYCLVNCIGYDNELKNPAVSKPNFDIKTNQYFGTLEERVRKMDKYNLVGPFCGLSMQFFKRELWKSLLNKKEHIGSNAVHLFILLDVMKKQTFAVIAKPLVKVRAANIRWDTFVGLETLRKRSKSTFNILLWILKAYGIPHSKIIISIKQNKDLFTSWLVSISRKYLFRSQWLRNLIKKILGKL